MLVVVTQLDIPCVWGGTLTGVLLKNDAAVAGKFGEKTIKIIGIHGWLDNLNSMLPLARKLIDRHPNYEIYLYDRAGHGFSSHIPKGFEYSDTHSREEIRAVIRTLGWDKEKYVIIGHSYGSILGMTYAASHSEEILCYIGIDGLPREQISSEVFWEMIGIRIDKRLDEFQSTSKSYKDDLTFEKAVSISKNTRPGITDEATKVLTERSVRLDKNNKLHFTRDESLKILSFYPYTKDMIENMVKSIKTPVLFIGSSNSQWPKPYKTIDLLKQYNPNFELSWIDGPHHLHMTHIDIVLDRIEQFFKKYLSQPVISTIENSKL